MDSQKETTRRRMQNEMLMLDSDLKKKERQKMDFQMEKKRIKQRMDQVGMDLAENDRQIKKLEQEQFLIANDINSLKKKINAL